MAILYETDFSSGNSSWRCMRQGYPTHTLGIQPLLPTESSPSRIFCPVEGDGTSEENGSILLRDINHTYEGLGWTSFPLFARIGELGLPSRLIGIRWEMTLRALPLYLPRTACLLPFIQTIDPTLAKGQGMGCIFYNIRQPVHGLLGLGWQRFPNSASPTDVADSGWKNFDLTLEPDPAHWVCGGRLPAYAGFYASAAEADIRTALENVNVNLGLVLLYGNTAAAAVVPNGPVNGVPENYIGPWTANGCPSDLATGRIECSHVKFSN